MSVTAVIPTMGRASLRKSVECAIQQPEVAEVVVVADGGGAADLAESCLDVGGLLGNDRLKLIVATNAGNGSKVRNIGTRLVKTEWVAYCDDDDYWLPHKVATQLNALAGHSNAFSSHKYWKHSARSVSIMPPEDPTDDNLGSLLLTRDRLTYQRGYCATPTLLLPTKVAVSIGWDERLKRHQDWDFVLRLQRDAQLHWNFVPEPLAVVDATTTSVSRKVTDPSPAVYFLNKHQGALGQLAAADFAAVHIAGVHFRAGEIKAGMSSLAENCNKYGRPHIAAVILALSRTIAFARQR